MWTVGLVPTLAMVIRTDLASKVLNPSVPITRNMPWMVLGSVVVSTARLVTPLRLAARVIQLAPASLENMTVKVSPEAVLLGVQVRVWAPLKVAPAVVG